MWLIVYHISSQRCQHRWINNAQKALHCCRLQLQTKRTFVLLQQNPRLNDGTIEQRSHNCGQQGDRYVTADVTEFAESQSIAVMSIHVHSGGGSQGAQHAGTEFDGCPGRVRKMGFVIEYYTYM